MDALAMDALDSLDRSLIAHLRREPGISSRKLSDALNVTQKTVRLRIRRLHSLNVLRVITMISLSAVGILFIAAAGIRIRGRAPIDVARDIARVKKVLTVNLVHGEQDLEIQIGTQSLAELSDLLTQVIGKISGVARVVLGVALRVLKHEVFWVPFPIGAAEASGPSLDDSALCVGDALDRRIVECLSSDSRLSNRAIARSLDVTEGTIRVRRRRLVSEGIVRSSTVLNVTQLKDPVVGYFWITVDSISDLQPVAGSLAALPEFTFVALMSGRCDVLAITLIESSEDLSVLLSERLGGISGISRTDYTLSRSIVKHDSRWCVA